VTRAAVGLMLACCLAFPPYSQLARPARTFLGKKTIEGTWAFMGHDKGLGLAGPSWSSVRRCGGRMREKRTRPRPCHWEEVWMVDIYTRGEQ
jgi:hypothetical protein